MHDLEQLTTRIKETFGDLFNSVVRLQDYKTTAHIHHSTLEIVVDHIEEQKVDVIVNATNTSLSGVSGIDKVIHSAAGPQLVAASRALAPCRAGDAVLTPGFKLPTPWVIHTVGPMYVGGHQDEATILDRTYRNCLNLAVQSGLTQIALPSISTRSNGYPIRDAAQIALGAVLEFIDGYRNSKLLIRIVLDSRTDFTVYDTVLKEFADPSKNSSAADTPTDGVRDEENGSSSHDLHATAPALDPVTDDEVSNEALENLENAETKTAEKEVLFVDVQSGSDIYLDIEETEVLSVEMGTKPADISLDNETINQKIAPATQLYAQPESVISIDLPASKNVETPEDVDLVAARAELESALNELQSAQNEFRSEREAEEAETARKEVAKKAKEEDPASAANVGGNEDDSNTSNEKSS